jgi:riboflavin kinase/FMN adenylyltransferase
LWDRQKMRLIRDPKQAGLEHDTVLTIGAFDGLHLGHQELLKRLVRRAKQTYRLSGVVTFDPHPRAVLTPADNAFCLTTTEDKVAILQQWGLDLLVVLPFTPELARTSARDFVQMLALDLRMTELWVGWDFALGRGREGDVQALKGLGKEYAFAVHEIAPVQEGDVVVSSTQIRGLIGAGRVREAAEMLGRYHLLRGRVVRGTGRGKQLGFPTANVQPEQKCLVPPAGVYAAYATVGKQRYLAAVNVGVRPTFGGHERTIEVHLLDFEGDLYGQDLSVQFVERLRDERRFPDEQALRSQIALDIARAREVLT